MDATRQSDTSINVEDDMIIGDNVPIVQEHVHSSPNSKGQLNDGFRLSTGDQMSRLPTSHPNDGDHVGGQHSKLTLTGAVLTIISTTIGGGIVGLPYAFYQTGLLLGPFALVLMAIQTTFSTELYFGAKDFLPGKPASFFEIGLLFVSCWSLLSDLWSIVGQLVGYLLLFF